MLTFPPPATIARHLISGWVHRLLGSVLVLLLGATRVHAQTPPPAPPITVLVRTQAGAAVPGVVLTLRPAPPAAGGPPAGTRAIQATTTAQGTADFPPLGGAIWVLTLAGTIAGRPLADPAAQGAPPWGTNPAGGGFPLSADPALEQAAAVPTEEAAAPVLVPLVLVDRGDLWLPALDLGGGTGRPLTLPAAAQLTIPAPLSGTPVVSGTRAVSPLPAAPSGAAPWLLLAGLPLLGLGLFGGLVLHRRRHPHQPAPAAYPAESAQQSVPVPRSAFRDPTSGGRHA